MKSRIFSDKFFNSQLWKLAVPIMIQSLMLASVAAADAFMLGGVDQNSMSAVSLASQIQFIQNLLRQRSQFWEHSIGEKKIKRPLAEFFA